MMYKINNKIVKTSNGFLSKNITSFNLNVSDVGFPIYNGTNTLIPLENRGMAILSPVPINVTISTGSEVFIFNANNQSISAKAS